MFISVIVPTHARPASLASCLDGLAAMDAPRGTYEVIVSDDGSPNSTAPVVERYRDRLQLTLLTYARSGPAGARNRGAARARGSHLAFLDDDCVPGPDWLAVLRRHLGEQPRALLGGRVVNALAGNPFAAASQQLVSYLCEYYGARPGSAPFFTSNNMAVEAARFRAIGSFDTGFVRAAGEDRELCDRWHSLGYPSRYVPEAVVYHSHPLTLRRFCRQHFNYGRAALRFHRLRAQRDRRGFRLEPPAFYTQMLRYPFTQGTGSTPWVHSALLGLSQVVNAAGTLRERLGTGPEAGAPEPASGVPRSQSP